MLDGVHALLSPAEGRSAVGGDDRLHRRRNVRAVRAVHASEADPRSLGSWPHTHGDRLTGVKAHPLHLRRFGNGALLFARHAGEAVTKPSPRSLPVIALHFMCRHSIQPAHQCREPEYGRLGS